MSELNLLLGPAIVAAIISRLVSLIVVQLNFRAERRAEKLRGVEKVRDFQIALRAEIASDLLNLQIVDRTSYLAQIAANYRADDTYSVVVPRMADNIIFTALVGELHILPDVVIDPVVHYERLRQTIEAFVLDLRAPSFAALPSERQLAMYSDYLEMLGRMEALAWSAYEALNAEISSLGVDRSSQSRAAAEGEASAGNSST